MIHGYRSGSLLVRGDSPVTGGGEKSVNSPQPMETLHAAEVVIPLSGHKGVNVVMLVFMFTCVYLSSYVESGIIF